MNKIINWIQEIFLDEVTVKALSHFSNEPQDVLKAVAVLEACDAAVLCPAPS